MKTTKTIANHKIELVDTGTFCNVRIYEPNATMFSTGGSFDNVETADKWATDKIIKAVKQRLEELRKELQTGQLIYGELHELQSLAPYIDKGDVELLEAAGVPEELPSEDTYYIEYLNASKRHAQDKVDFTNYNEAVIWGKANLENFNSDMIRIKR